MGAKSHFLPPSSVSSQFSVHGVGLLAMRVTVDEARLLPAETRREAQAVLLGRFCVTSRGKSNEMLINRLLGLSDGGAP